MTRADCEGAGRRIIASLIAACPRIARDELERIRRIRAARANDTARSSN